jgi:hypothetical protein
MTVTDISGTQVSTKIRNTGGQWKSGGQICNRSRPDLLEPNKNCFNYYSYDLIVGDEKWNLYCSYHNEGVCWQVQVWTCWGDGNPWNCNCAHPPPCGNPHECASLVGISCGAGCYPYGAVQNSVYYYWGCQ